MKKRILGALSVFTYSVYLVVMSGISEIDAAGSIGSEVAECNIADEAVPHAATCEWKLTAGACDLISKYSFTTESGLEIETSDLETMVEKHETVVVTTPANLNRWGIELTEDEIELLAKIVWVEARGESQEGQEAVVEVVFNRMASELYPDTLYDVLSQGNPVQFSSWRLRDTATPTDKEYESIYNVLNGNTNILRDDTLYFSTFMMTSNLDVQIENHYFCY